MKNIELSVALPLYRAEHVAWIALESLCRQSVIDFEWELLIAEENYKETMGLANVNKFRDRLLKVGCNKIEYIPLKKWIPLSEKWKLLSGIASKTSVGFVLQSADCYSNNNRLSITLNLFKKGADWVHSRTHLIYDMINDRYYTYIRGEEFPAADMAVKTDLIKRIPKENVWKGVDSWIFNKMKEIKVKTSKNAFCVMCDDSDNWTRSLNVHGLNNITYREKSFGKKIKLVEDVGYFIKNFPPEILEKIKKYRKYTFNRKLIRPNMIRNKEL